MPRPSALTYEFSNGAWSSTNRETEFTIPITKTTTLGRKVKAVNPYDTYWKFGDLMEDNEYYQGVLCDLSDFGGVLVDYEAS